MNEVIYTYVASPQRPEELKRDLRERRGDIASTLDLFEVPWEKEFFGIDTRNNLETHLGFDGEIRVTGSDERKCQEKVSEIQKTLEHLLETVPYEETKLKEVKFERQAEAAIGKIVPPEILKVVSEKISPNYYPCDVSFEFEEKQTGKNLEIYFERNRPYKQGEKIVPLRITVIASTSDVCKEIFDALIEQFKRQSLKE